MCDHCGCRDQPPIGELMDEHDRIMELAWRLVDRPTEAGSSSDEVRIELRTLLAMHAEKEEQALYPLLVASGDMEAADRVLFEQEHVDLLALVDGAEFDTSGSNLLAAHIKAEELELFPGTMFAFGDEAWEQMERVSHELFHEFGISHDHIANRGSAAATERVLGEE